MYLKSIGATAAPAATAAGSFLRRATSLALGLWQRTQYCVWLRRLPWIEKPFENSPWQDWHLASSTTTRRTSASWSSTVKVTTGLAAASLTVRVAPSGAARLTERR